MLLVNEETSGDTINSVNVKKFEQTHVMRRPKTLNLSNERKRPVPMFNFTINGHPIKFDHHSAEMNSEKQNIQMSQIETEQKKNEENEKEQTKNESDSENFQQTHNISFNRKKLLSSNPFLTYTPTSSAEFETTSEKTMHSTISLPKTEMEKTSIVAENYNKNTDKVNEYPTNIWEKIDSVNTREKPTIEPELISTTIAEINIDTENKLAKQIPKIDILNKNEKKIKQ